VFGGVLGEFVILVVALSKEYWRAFKEWEAGADLTRASKAETVSRKRAVALEDISGYTTEY